MKKKGKKQISLHWKECVRVKARKYTSALSMQNNCRDAGKKGIFDRLQKLPQKRAIQKTALSSFAFPPSYFCFLCKFD